MSVNSRGTGEIPSALKNLIEGISGLNEDDMDICSDEISLTTSRMDGTLSDTNRIDSSNAGETDSIINLNIKNNEHVPSLNDDTGIPKNTTQEKKHYDVNIRYSKHDTGPYWVYVESTDLITLHAIRVGHYIHLDPNLKHAVNSINAIGKNKVKIQMNSYKSANDVITSPFIIKNKLVAYIPTFFVQKKGVISGVDTYFTCEYIKENIICENFKILNVQRFKKKITNPDGTIKFVDRQKICITFSGNNLPNFIVINSVRFVVEPYYYPVIQCFKCLRYGHVKDSCKGSPKCKNCGVKDCINFSVCKTNNTKCIYCNSTSHNSLFRGCPEHLKQKNIKKIMSEQNVSFREAEKINDNPSFSKIATFNKFEVLGNYKEIFPPLPNSSNNTLLNKPKNPNPKAISPPPIEPAKKRKIATHKENSSILPNPYRDEFMNQKEKIIISVVEFINNCFSNLKNQPVDENVFDYEKTKNAITNLLNDNFLKISNISNGESN